jgi:hypothetical protein
MNLQALLETTPLDLSERQIKAFFLGMLCAQKIPSPSQAADEFLSDFPDLRSSLTVPLKELYGILHKNLRSELFAMIPDESKTSVFLETAKEQIDFFLTGMSLAGTNTEDCDDEELADLIDELEDCVEDIDNFLADTEATPQDGEAFKAYLLELWNEFASSK